MKAIVLDQSTGTPLVKMVDRPIPVPGRAEVLVRVKAAGLNYRELSWAEDGNLDATWPIIMGGDAAGVIAGVGEGVSGWREGDRVVINPGVTCGECRFCRRGQDYFCEHLQALGWNMDGTFAEYVKVPARNLSLIPAHLDFNGAAALPIAYGTAWNTLFTQGELRPGETVLISGVGGGVALFSLQIAARIGAKVIVTSGSDEKLERALALGAAHGINYRTTDVLAAVKELTHGDGVDLAIDGIGKETLVTSFAATSRAGRVVRYGSVTGGLQVPSGHLLKTSKYGHIATYSDWEAAMRFAENVRLQPVVDCTFVLEQFEEAFDHLRQQKQFGKVVLTLGEQEA